MAWRLTETTTIEGALNDVPLGRRSLKRLDGQDWFIDLPEIICREASVDTGDSATLLLRVASTVLPKELATLLASDAEARRSWERLTASQQRMLREHVAAARQAATRERRARSALGRPR